MASTGTDGGLRDRLARVPLWVRELLLIAVLYTAYEFTRGLGGPTLRAATRNGWDILHFERHWDISPEHWLTVGLLAFTPLAVAAAYFYSTAHYIVTPVVLIWMYRCHGDHYRPARTSLAISTLIGLLGFWFIPTAPPRSLVGSGVPDALARLSHWGWWGGEGSVPKGLGSFTNQLAAMPSMHVGWALWCGFLIHRYASRAWVRWLGVAYPVATTLVVLSTGNHYLLDAVAGAFVMALGAGLMLAGRAVRQRLFTRPSTAVASAPESVERLDAGEVSATPRC